MLNLDKIKRIRRQFELDGKNKENFSLDFFTFKNKEKVLIRIVKADVGIFHGFVDNSIPTKRRWLPHLIENTNLENPICPFCYISSLAFKYLNQAENSISNKSSIEVNTSSLYTLVNSLKIRSCIYGLLLEYKEDKYKNLKVEPKLFWFHQSTIFNGIENLIELGFKIEGLENDVFDISIKKSKEDKMYILQAVPPKRNLSKVEIKKEYFEVADMMGTYYATRPEILEEDIEIILSLFNEATGENIAFDYEKLLGGKNEKVKVIAPSSPNKQTEKNEEEEKEEEGEFDLDLDEDLNQEIEEFLK